MSREMLKGVSGSMRSDYNLSDGTYPVIFDLTKISRADFRVFQQGNSGAISFEAYVSYTEHDGKHFADLLWTDCGLKFYDKATFDDAEEMNIDSGWLETASAIKFVFTVSGSSGDSAYNIEGAFVATGAR
jgi:hypothetical protein